jgi:hypothetical protein
MQPSSFKPVLGTGLFLLVSFTLGRRFVFDLIRWTNDTFVSEVPVVTAILIVMGVMAMITHWIGVHTVLGAFVAGILVGESPILTRHIDEQLRGLVVALFMPVFFALAGLNADLSILADPRLLALLRHERARLNGGDRRIHRTAARGYQSGPVHDDRDSSNRDHPCHAAELTLGPVKATVA